MGWQLLTAVCITLTICKIDYCNPHLFLADVPNTGPAVLQSGVLWHVLRGGLLALGGNSNDPGALNAPLAGSKTNGTVSASSELLLILPLGLKKYENCFDDLFLILQ